MARRRLIMLFLTVATLGVTTTIIGGCAKTRFRTHPTPKMFSLTKSNDQAGNNYYYRHNLNFRAIIDDIGRLTLSDRPSRLINAPTPY